MKRTLLAFFGLLLCTVLSAQTTILDFETPETSTTYQYFGSPLEPGLNNIIANPDPTGINTSANVADHVKPADAQVWAGAFPNPALQTPADMIANGQVCIKVWFNQAGNVAVKLEGSSTGGPNWVTTQPVTTTQTWTEVCFDVSVPSEEDPFQPAAGHIYDVVVLFFDFQQPGTDQTYYWDDLVTVPGVGPSTGDITFSVDMNDYADPFTTPYVSGSFNGWDGAANPMEDGDGDGVWTATVADIPNGVHEYKIQLDQWATQEEFNGFETCTISSDGMNINRSLVVSGDATIPTHCYNSCYECGDAVNITFEVGAGNIVVSPDGIYIAGGGNFGVPGDFPLNDDDMDGVWTATMERQKGFNSFFTITNGACPDFSCKEDIAGQDCADPNNFNDRFLPPVTQDTTLATCFGECTTDWSGCGGMVVPANVTFQVDMNDYADPFTTVYLAGTMNGWTGDANPMDDSDGDGIWETSLELAPGTYEYKFPLDNWAVDEAFSDGDPCTITDPSGQFVNRFIEVTTDATVCFKWQTCIECDASSTRDLTIDHTLFELSPNVTSNFANLYFTENMNEQKTVLLLNTTGTLVQEIQLGIDADQYQLDLSNMAPGLYLVTVQTESKLATKKLVRQ